MSIENLRKEKDIIKFFDIKLNDNWLNVQKFLGYCDICLKLKNKVSPIYRFIDFKVQPLFCWNCKQQMYMQVDVYGRYCCYGFKIKCNLNEKFIELVKTFINKYNKNYSYKHENHWENEIHLCICPPFDDDSDDDYGNGYNSWGYDSCG